jgi:ABC-type sugar transport system ATPase subunit
VQILSGALNPDAGQLEVDGRAQGHLTPRQARRAAISTVPQRRELVPRLRDTGVAIIFISHHISEVLHLASA